MPTPNIPQTRGAFHVGYRGFYCKQTTHWFAGIHASRAQQYMERTLRADVKAIG